MRSTLLRALVLVSCTFLGLVCGTLYLYLLYAPQLAARLGYLAAQLSSIALFGGLGVALAGPGAGAVVDAYGYSAPLVVGAAAIVAGYTVLQRQFDLAWTSVAVLRLALFVVGCGSTLINQACLKCCSVSFPRMRGVATALVLALYGLLAMFYLVAGAVLFAGDTLRFIAFLARLLWVVAAVCAPMVMLRDRARPQERLELRLPAPARAAEKPEPGLAPVAPHESSDISGTRLLRLARFWLLFVATGALAGTGQMYIYSVGYMTKALVAAANSAVDEAAFQSEQQLQVGLLSVANCLGRLAAGVSGDMLHLVYDIPRRRLLLVPSVGLWVAQAIAAALEAPRQLAVALLLTGFFYGYTFCMMPLVVGDEFGIRHFLANWGMMALAPMLPSYLFTSMFGRIYDLRLVDGVCAAGRTCYCGVFVVALGAVLAAAVLVVLFNLGRVTYQPRTVYIK